MKKMSDLPSMSNGSQNITFKSNTFQGVNQVIITQTKNDSSTRYIEGLEFDLPGKLQHPIIGRENDVIEIATRLQEEVNHHVAITGLAGMGKTTLAIYCARCWRENKNVNFHNIAFIHAENRDKIERSLKILATKLNIPKDQSTRELLKDIVDIYKSKSLLLILDNLERCKDITEFLDLPDNVYLLATSQNTELYEQFDCYALNELSDETSILLLKTIIIEDSLLLDNEELHILIEELCDLLQGLPIALTHAASWIKDEASANKRINPRLRKLKTFDSSTAPSVQLYIQSITKYIEKYRQILDKPFPDQFITTNNKAAFLAIKLNIEKVDVLACGTMLNMLSYLDPDFVELEIFELIFDKEELDNKLRELLKFSLINIDIIDKFDENIEYLNIHRLTQEVIRQMYATKESELVPLIIVLTLYKEFMCHHEMFIESKINEQEIVNLLVQFPIQDMTEILKQLFTSGKVTQGPIIQLQKLDCNVSGVADWPLPHLILSSFVYGGYIEALPKLLSNMSPDMIQATVGDGITALHVAAASSHYRSDIIAMLIKFGADVNAKTERGLTPLHVACTTNVALTIRELVKSGALIDGATDIEDSPLHDAARNLSYRAISCLLRRGADVNRTNVDGDTALHLAAAVQVQHDNEWDVARTLRCLLDANASLDAMNRLGETPLDVAVKLNNTYTANWFRHPREMRRKLC